MWLTVFEITKMSEVVVGTTRYTLCEPHNCITHLMYDIISGLFMGAVI